MTKTNDIQVTKYSPQFYQDIEKETWTSISDIGKEIDGHILTFEEYISIEKKHISAAFILLEEKEKFFIKKLEKSAYHTKYFPDENLKEFFDSVINEALFDIEMIEPIIKLILRECCLLYTSPSPRDATLSRMPSSA